MQISKLKVRQGAMDCLKLCSANSDCWTFNYLKSKKLCYLMSSTSEEVDARKSGQFACGYRQCEDTDGSWNNTPMDFNSGDSSGGGGSSASSGSINSVPSPPQSLTLTASMVVNDTMCTKYGALNGYSDCQWTNNNCCICPSCPVNCPFHNCANYGR